MRYEQKKWGINCELTPHFLLLCHVLKRKPEDPYWISRSSILSIIHWTDVTSSVFLTDSRFWDKNGGYGMTIAMMTMKQRHCESFEWTWRWVEWVLCTHGNHDTAERLLLKFKISRHKNWDQLLATVKNTSFQMTNDQLFQIWNNHGTFGKKF